MYLPEDAALGVVLQQDGFLDKEMVKVTDLDPKERPINQHWSWDRILRSPTSNKPMCCKGCISLKINSI